MRLGEKRNHLVRRQVVKSNGLDHARKRYITQTTSPLPVEY
jgi:hypothetical protein